MPDPYIETLRLEYLQYSKELYRQIQNGASDDQLQQLKNHINILLTQIKQGDKVRPEDLIND
jgi:hypothetical protein